MHPLNRDRCQSSLQATKLEHYEPAVAQRVQSWLASGEPLRWIPVATMHDPSLSARQERLICQPSDLLLIPENQKGWLIPSSDNDTDVVCELHEGEILISTVAHKLTGRKQTLRGEVVSA